VYNDKFIFILKVEFDGRVYIIVKMAGYALLWRWQGIHYCEDGRVYIIVKMAGYTLLWRWQGIHSVNLLWRWQGIHSVNLLWRWNSTVASRSSLQPADHNLHSGTAGVQHIPTRVFSLAVNWGVLCNPCVFVQGEGRRGLCHMEWYSADLGILVLTSANLLDSLRMSDPDQISRGTIV
jgi:hypothetical protein